MTAACTNKKSVNPLANVGSKQPDKVLFDRAMDATKHNRFDVARMTLQTLINTYPDSKSVAALKLAEGDSWLRKAGPPPSPRPSRCTATFRPFSRTCLRPPRPS